MKTLTVFIFVMGTLAFGEIANAGYLSKCDVVRSLRRKNVPDSEMRDWLCLVKHESSFQYDAFNAQTKDYGIYQISGRYWCDRGATKYSICWKINAFGCGYRCSDFLNSDLTFGTDCAVKIKNCNSFEKWYGWVNGCKGQNLDDQPEYDFYDC